MELPPPLWTAYRARLRDERGAGWLTAAQLDVLEAIANLNFAGDWEPTVARIAVYAGCSARTVQRAKAVGKARGLLAVKSQFSAKWQEADHYELVLPTTPVTLKPAKRKGRQSVTPSRKKEERKRLPKAENAFRAGASLAAIAKRRMAALGLGP